MKMLMLVVIVFASVLVACAVKSTPAPPSTSPPATIAPALNVPTANPQEVAWDKVVEAARKEGTVTAYTYTLVGDTSLALTKAFKDRYGITLESTGAANMPMILERLKTEKRTGTMVGDVVEGGSSDLALAKLAGVLDSVGDRLPVSQEKGVWSVDPTVSDPNGKSVLIYRLNLRGPWINTNLIKPGDEPHSWKDLLNPKWKTQIIMADPAIASGFYQLVVPLRDKKIWDEGYIKDMYGQSLLMTKSEDDALSALSRGDRSLMFHTTDAAGSRFVIQGAPIKAIDMREGMVLSGAALGAVAGGPHPNASLVFLNWMLGPEGQTIRGKVTGNRMVRSDVLDFRPQAAQVKVTNAIWLSQEYVDQAAQLFKDRWFNKVVDR